MTRLFPYPLVSAALVLSWVAVTELSAAHIALGAVLAIAIPYVVSPFLQGLPRVRGPLRALRLLVRLAWDVVVANVVVTALVLGPMGRLRPVFFEVPLAVRHPHALTLLASIITMTPGTVSAALAPDGRVLHVHALSAEDPAVLVATIKERYERPLLEIFEC
ncbi:MAG: Na+/H+ antiporter subunit E [Burkholderiales bacterium]